MVLTKNNIVLAYVMFFCLFRFLSLQPMSGVTFRSIFEGKQSKFDDKVMVDSGLLSKLQDYGIITTRQSNAIEVTNVSVCIIE